MKSVNSKPVIERHVIGYVKWYSDLKGYGFIRIIDATNKDIFVHQSSIARINPETNQKSLSQNERVVFDLVIGDKGFEASNVISFNLRPIVESE